MSSGSTIEKLGVRVGDIIQHLNGEWVSDTIQVKIIFCMAFGYFMLASVTFLLIVLVRRNVAETF